MYTKIDNINIFYEFVNLNPQTQNKSFLVFLHEGLGSTKQWFGFHKELSEALNLPAISYDRYGYGKSDELKDKRPLDYQKKEAYFLNKLLKKIKIPLPVILFGHSDGATIALMYAALFPNNVKAVISEAHHVIIEKHTQLGVLQAIEAYEKTNFRNALMKYHGNKVDSMFYAWANTSALPEALNFNMTNYLPKISAPVLAIQGTNDQYGTFEQLKLIKQYCNKSKILFVQDCDHYPHRNKKDFIINSVRNFLYEFDVL
jgi:pimeloyl-ACP methyl ester carboxylesterase